MNREAKKFLLKVIGADGVQLLTKAAEQFPELTNVFLPRAILSWLSVAQEAEYGGKIPGLTSRDTVCLKKSEPGMATIGGETYVIDYNHPESSIQVAAALCVALGADQHPIPDGVQPEQISKLSKSLDLLVKSKVIAWLEEESSSADDEDEDLEKTNLPGKAAGPRAPEEPEAPEGQKKQPSMGGPAGTRITRSENFPKELLKSACVACGKSQLHLRWNTFEGCDCISALVKSERPKVEIGLDRKTYRITADSDTILLLSEILHGDDPNLA